MFFSVSSTVTNRIRNADTSSDDNDKSTLDLRRQLAVSTQETQMLQKRIANYETTIERINEENKKYQVKTFLIECFA